MVWETAQQMVLDHLLRLMISDRNKIARGFLGNGCLPQQFDQDCPTTSGRFFGSAKKNFQIGTGGNVVRRLRKPTEELIFVIAGRMKVVLNEKEYLLDPGDSVYFNGFDLQELSCASTDQDVIWISVITPPIF